MADKQVKGPQAVSSAFIEKDKKFLLVFCPRFKVWRVPGGRVERTETAEEALLRELKEEVGLDFKNPKFLGYGQDHQYLVRDKKETSRLILFFHVKTDKNLKIDPEEAEDFKWVSLEQLKRHVNKEGALEDFFEKNPNLNL